MTDRESPPPLLPEPAPVRHAAPRQWWPLTAPQKRFVVFFCACIGLVLAAAYAVLEQREDRGLRGHQPRSHFPLSYEVDTTARDWREDATWAVKWINAQCSLHLFAGTSTASGAAPASIHIDMDTALGGDERGFAKGKNQHATLAWVDKDGGSIARCTITVAPVVDVLSFPERRRRVLVHELGHCLGEQHDDQEESWMYPTAAALNGSTGTYRISAKDCEELRIAYPWAGQTTR